MCGRASGLTALYEGTACARLDECREDDKRDNRVVGNLFAAQYRAGLVGEIPHPNRKQTSAVLLRLAEGCANIDDDDDDDDVDDDELISRPSTAIIEETLMRGLTFTGPEEAVIAFNQHLLNMPSDQ
ncbi:hypothetical protein EVAR_20413_1 [Eumeta japonica]|uniref:Uncharacterized protein n=1 Tax=Eumeta variegata TaxID=151549 RepID=A0A4C1TXV2_EUMVA|nr:hypothetical protein EVAR_20413_1 [Eumeta japonica]